MPATLTVLATLVEHGALPPAQGRFVAADDSEDAEYGALTEAAEASAGMLGAPGRRVVIVADLPDPDSAVPVNLVVAVHADSEDVDPTDGELPDLGWYAAQEIPDLIG